MMRKIDSNVAYEKVNLNRQVNAWYERKLAEDAAWSDAKVTSVENTPKISGE